MGKILVADDNSNIQKMVTLALKGLGLQVVCVGNGEAAVRKLPELMPDLVLADIFMPVRSGYEVCEFVKTDARFAHMPVILLVGAFDPLDEKEMQRVGADGVLKKPFVPPDALIAMVQGTLKKIGAAQTTEAPLPGPEVLKMADTAKPSASEPAWHQALPEAEQEEFSTRPIPIEFRAEDSATPFGDLLETSPSSPEAKSEATALPGSNSEEIHEVGEGAGQESLPPSGANAAFELSGSETEHSFGREEEDGPEPEPEEWHPETLSTIENAQAEEVPPAPAEREHRPPFSQTAWADALTSFPRITLPVTPENESASAPPEIAAQAEPPARAEAETPTEHTEYAQHADSAEQAQFAEHAEPIEAGEPEPLPSHAGEPSAPEPVSSHFPYSKTAEPAYEPPPAEHVSRAESEPEIAQEPPQPVAPPPAHDIEWRPIPPPSPFSPAVEHIPAPQSVDPLVLDAVVQKVMASLEPQILELISHNLVRPAVEAFLQNEILKKE